MVYMARHGTRHYFYVNTETTNNARGWMTQIEQAGWLRTVTEGGIVVVAVVDTT